MFACTCEPAAAGEGATTITVAIRGRATVEHAREVWEAVSRALLEAEQVALELDEVSEADLSIVQVLLAAWKSAEAGGRSIVLSRAPSAAFRSIVKEAGLSLPMETRSEVVQ